MRWPHVMVAPIAALALALPASAPASPPACMRDDAAMVAASEAVVTAQVLSARESRSGTTQRLEARYRVIEGLKGRLKAGHHIRVVDSCLDEPVPPSLQGFPAVQRYCRGGIAPSLTGIEAANARPQSPAPPEGWPLFLRLNRGDDDWSEVSRTSYGGGCSVDDATLSDENRRSLERLRQRGKAAP
jgi:hypothetical protein